MGTFSKATDTAKATSIGASQNILAIKDKISSTASSQAKRITREASKQSAQTDKGTGKVINTTKTVATPFVTSVAAFTAANAYRAYTKEIAKQTSKIDNIGLVNEAKKHGLEFNNEVRMRTDDQVSHSVDKEKGEIDKGILLQNGVEHAGTINGTGRNQSAVIGYEDLYTHSKFVRKETVLDENGQPKLRPITKRPVTKDVFDVNQKSDLVHNYAESQLAAVRAQIANSVGEGESLKKLTVEGVEKLVADNSFRYQRNCIEAAEFTFDVDYSKVGKTNDINKIIKSTKLNTYSMNREAANSLNHLRLLSMEMAKERDYSVHATNKLDRFNKTVAKTIERGLRTRSFINDLGDKELNKFMKLQEKAARHEKRYRKLRSPKSFLRSGFRILTMPLQQSETMQGVGYLRTGAQGTLGFTKVVINPALCIAENSTTFVRKCLFAGKIAKDSGISYKMAFKNMKDAQFMENFAREFLKGKMPEFKYVNLKDFVKNPLLSGMRSFFKDDISAKLIDFAGQRLLGDTHGMFANYFGTRLMNQALVLDGAASKGQAKALNKVANKALRTQIDAAIHEKMKETVVGKSFSAGMNIAKKPLAAFGKTKFGKVAKKGFELLMKPFQMLMKALEKIAQSFAEIMAFIVKWILIAIAAILIFFILLQLFYMTCLQLESILGWGNRFSLSGAEDFTARAEKFIDVLEECHDEQLAELKEKQSEYETADIEYPSGEQENYKELWCALAVSTQYDPTILTKAEIKDIAKDYYKQTHRVTVTEYDYNDADGSTKKAAHIFLDIQRAEGLAYEELADVWDSAQASSSSYYNGAAYAVATEVQNDDWMAVVKSLKAAIASTGVGYSQSSYVKITVNGNTMSVRQDCSGYVSACLQVYGAQSATWSSHQFTDASSIPGFTKYAWSGWGNLAPGDIIAYHGHVEIFAYNLDKYHYVYSNGSSNSVRSAVPTTDSRSYVTVWRPNSAGSVDSVTNVNSEELEAADTTKIQDFEPTFSNTSDVVWNEDGNEDGYEDTLVADINAELASTTHFTPGRYAAAYTDHSLTSASSAASAWDFVRYIYAKHGVAIPFESGSFGSQVSVGYHENLLKVGDIIWYAPHTVKFDALQAELEGKGKNITNMGSIYRTAVLSDDGKTKESVSHYMVDNVIPVIYMGDGKVCAFSKDLLAANDNGSGALRTYKLSDLDNARIYNITRVKGFTVAPVFGYTTYFEGWTDDNISYFMQLLYDECWTTGSKDISKAKFVDDNGNGIESVDYSWYKEDYFEGNDVYWSDAHASTFESDLVKVLISYYDDYGILPSVGYTTACALSNNRSTGESLTYFNVWEQLESSERDADSEDKYSYDESGDATVISRDFKKYKSYLEAYKDWVNKLTSLQIDTTNYSFNTFATQLGYLNNHAGINADTKAAAQARYAEDSIALDSADETAIERKELIDDMEAIHTELAGHNFTSTGKSEVKGGDDRKRYYRACELLNQYYSTYQKFKSLIEETDTATDKTNRIMQDFERDYPTYKAKAEAMYDYWSAHKDSEYIEEDAKITQDPIYGNLPDGTPWKDFIEKTIPATHESWERKNIPSL